MSVHLVHRYAGVVYPAIWLIGLGILFATTNNWWPGVIFLAGASAMVYGLTGSPGSYRSLQAGLLAVGIGVWVLLHYSLASLFVVLGIVVLLAAVLRPMDQTPKPPTDTDQTLE
jgi:O-antigen ligase